MQKIVNLYNSKTNLDIYIIWNMLLSDFDYSLPKELIAQNPTEPRDHSRLLVLWKKSWVIEEKKFYEILDELWEDDVLVLNKTKVINARLYAKIVGLESSNKKSDFLVEIFLHKQVSENTWDCLVYPWKKIKVWKKLAFYLKKKWRLEEKILEAEVKKISDSWRIIEFNKSWKEFLEVVEKLWEVPLPPYIKEELKDKNRYQTVWAEVEWSVASPTASLHFTEDILKKLKKKWVKIEKVLLHVWIWTFMPVEKEDIKKHKMHSEYIEIDESTSKRLNKYKSEWKRIIAVWTTSVRVLESMVSLKWVLGYWKKDTDIFIYPWYNWGFIDGMITNFHLPKSTLLMLVSSFAWKDNIDKAYRYAIKNKFRFFSLGDCMFIR